GVKESRYTARARIPPGVVSETCTVAWIAHDLDADTGPARSQCRWETGASTGLLVSQRRLAALSRARTRAPLYARPRRRTALARQAAGSRQTVVTGSRPYIASMSRCRVPARGRRSAGARCGRG